MNKVFFVLGLLSASVTVGADVNRPVKVVILAGDENCLEQAAVAGRTDGSDVLLYLTGEPVKDEVAGIVHCEVRKGTTVAATGGVGMGEPRKKKQAQPWPVFPELAFQDGYTTVVRGFLSVPRSGRYEVRPGAGDAAFNVTTLDGKEAYRHEIGQAKPTVASVSLEAKQRYPFETVYFKKPGTEFRAPQVSIPGTLETVMAEKKPYAFLKDLKRDDVMLYDAHPIQNNTRAPGRPLQVTNAVGPELMLGTVLGNHFAEPVFLLRFATRHPIWFLRGSRSLGHDYLPPSSGGDPNLQGSWDVIHFNWGVWDAGWKDKSSKYYQGHGNTTSVADFEQNLRTLVARMKQTGATLIWASVTPVWKGEPDKPNADVVAYNAVAEKVMKENGVIINDLNALVPKGTGSWVSPDVHAVGNLAPQVIQTIRAALASRPKKTKPLPRVLLIGDSITGSYQEAVMKNLDGEAAVFKNPGNAESTWTGLKRIDEWLDLKRYLQNGQEYLELVNSVNDSLAQLPRFLPGYQNQGYEIAGLVWMQGIADSGSPAHAAAYEKNLANLIRDLRRDLKAPKMPVVVAALKMGDGKVYDAQRAVGETARYPEFFGNVTVVDTQPFFCGGDPRTLGSHAETILEVGETLGQSLLKLMEVK
jgi:lysophospholipase L1-like esterase